MNSVSSELSELAYNILRGSVLRLITFCICTVPLRVILALQNSVSYILSCIVYLVLIHLVKSFPPFRPAFKTLEPG